MAFGGSVQVPLTQTPVSWHWDWATQVRNRHGSSPTQMPAKHLQKRSCKKGAEGQRRERQAGKRGEEGVSQQRRTQKKGFTDSSNRPRGGGGGDESHCSWQITMGPASSYRSRTVASSPSSQGLPSLFTGSVQTPRLQMPASWHWSEAAQLTPPQTSDPRQTPVMHWSSSVCSLPSSPAYTGVSKVSLLGVATTRRWQDEAQTPWGLVGVQART